MIDQLDDVQWGKLLAEAWLDSDFKSQLESDPNTVIREFAQREFNLDIKCELDSLSVPDAPTGMDGEQLSGVSYAAACATGCGTTGGNVGACATGTGTAGGN